MPRFRRTRIAVVSATALATGIAGLTAMAAPAGAAPTSSGTPNQAVIVVLRDQLSTAPATRAHLSQRSGQAHSAQDAVLARLQGPKPTKVKHYTLGNAFSATVTAAQAGALAADPAVASVVADRKVAVQRSPATPADAHHEPSPRRRPKTTAGPPEVDRPPPARPTRPSRCSSPRRCRP